MMWSLGTGGADVSATGGALLKGNVPAALAAGAGRLGVFVAKPRSVNVLGRVNVLPHAKLGFAHDRSATSGPARAAGGRPGPGGDAGGGGHAGRAAGAGGPRAGRRHSRLRPRVPGARLPRRGRAAG